MRSLFPRLMIGWLVLGFLFWTWYILTRAFAYQLLYFYVWLGVLGIPFWRYRDWIAHWLRSWRAGNLQKFLLLGYGMVLLEEIIAALMNNLSEGFGVALLVQRVGQFWAFNILAFTGFIVGWYLLLTQIRYGRVERFFLAGCWGLVAEGVINSLFSNPLATFFLAPLMIYTYGFILTPAMLSLEEPETRTVSPPVRVILAFVVPLVFSILPLTVLFTLRGYFPGLFPPPDMLG